MIATYNLQIATRRLQIAICEQQSNDNHLEINKFETSFSLTGSGFEITENSEEQCETDLEKQKSALASVEKHLKEQEAAMDQLKSEKQAAENSEDDCRTDFQDQKSNYTSLEGKYNLLVNSKFCIVLTLKFYLKQFKLRHR